MPNRQDVTIVKTCSCGQKYTMLLWSSLKYLGVQSDLELRLCTKCESTMSMPHTQKMSITVPLDITLQRIASLICVGIEGGINYWATVTGYRAPEPTPRFRHSKAAEFKHIDWPLSPGSGVYRRYRGEKRKEVRAGSEIYLWGSSGHGQ